MKMLILSKSICAETPGTSNQISRHTVHKLKHKISHHRDWRCLAQVEHLPRKCEALD
jgi:hypothetical protein